METFGCRFKDNFHVPSKFSGVYDNGLILLIAFLFVRPPRKKDTKYTPISLRQEKPFAILWLIKRYPTELSGSQIAKLTGSTKNTVEAIRTGNYREAVLETKSPMDIGLCSYEELEKTLNRSRKKSETKEEAKED